MHQTVFYNVHHEPTMGGLIVAYFFLTGLGAGAFLTAAGCRIFGGGRYSATERTAAFAAPVLLIPGLFCLLLDLGRPFRVFNMILHFNPSSVASWGVWLMSLFAAVCVINAFLHWQGRAERAAPLAYVGFFLALAVGLYSGMLLYQMRGHALWHSALVPPIFLASAIASGLAVVLLLSGSAEAEQANTLSKVLAAAVGADLVLALTELLTLGLGGGEKAEVARVILSGGYGVLFVGVYLILGLALPLAVLVRRRSSRAAQVAAAVLVLAGTLAMRYVMVMGGEALPLS